MSSKNWMFVAAVLVLAAGCGQKKEEGAPPPVDDAQQAASSALATLQKIVTEQNYKGLGFNSATEVKGAALAQPLPLYNIDLNRVKSFKSGQDLNTLLTASTETIYPVTVGGQVRSSVTVVKKGKGFTTASFGNAAIVRGLSRYRTKGMQGAFAVRVPFLSSYFLGNRIGNKVLLIPVAVDSRLHLREGAAVPADQVLNAIVPIAQAYNGLPM